MQGPRFNLLRTFDPITMIYLGIFGMTPSAASTTLFNETFARALTPEEHSASGQLELALPKETTELSQLVVRAFQNIPQTGDTDSQAAAKATHFKKIHHYLMTEEVPALDHLLEDPWFEKFAAVKYKTSTIEAYRTLDQLLKRTSLSAAFISQIVQEYLYSPTLKSPLSLELQEKLKDAFYTEPAPEEEDIEDPFAAFSSSDSDSDDESLQLDSGNDTALPLSLTDSDSDNDDFGLKLGDTFPVSVSSTSPETQEVSSDEESDNDEFGLELGDTFPISVSSTSPETQEVGSDEELDWGDEEEGPSLVLKTLTGDLDPSLRELLNQAKAELQVSLVEFSNVYWKETKEQLTTILDLFKSHVSALT